MKVWPVRIWIKCTWIDCNLPVQITNLTQSVYHREGGLVNVQLKYKVIGFVWEVYFLFSVAAEGVQGGQIFNSSHRGKKIDLHTHLFTAEWPIPQGHRSVDLNNCFQWCLSYSTKKTNQCKTKTKTENPICERKQASGYFSSFQSIVHRFQQQTDGKRGTCNNACKHIEHRFRYSFVCLLEPKEVVNFYASDKANQQLQSQINIAIEYGKCGQISGALGIIVLFLVLI